MEPFNISNSITKEDYSNLLLKISYKRPIIIIISIVGLLMLFTAILNSLGVVEMHNSSNLPIFQYLFGAFVLILPFFTKMQAQKIYDNSPQLHNTSEYTFSNQGINIRGKNVSSANTWEMVIKREEVGNFMLLYIGHNIAQILNKENYTKEQLDFVRSKILKN